MYDSDASTVTDSLNAANTTVFSQNTIDQILALTTKTGDTKIVVDTVTPDANGNVTTAAGSEIVYVAANDASVKVNAPANAPVVIFQGKGGVVATINDGATTAPSGSGSVDRVVIGSAGDDKITVQDAKNTKIILGTGNSSVQAGLGADTVEAGLGNSTITGGGDYTVVKLAGAANNYTVTVNNGHAIVTNNTSGKTTDLSKVQYVQLDANKALVFAKDSIEATVSTLYHVAFGRDADAGGLNYWFDIARAGATTKQIANAFASSAEFAPQKAMPNAEFVSALYQNTFGRAGEDSGIAYWISALEGGASRGDLINSFATIGANNIAGTIQTETQVVGSVSIITGIV